MVNNNDKITIKIGLYSGMPNPEMILSVDKTPKFIDLVKSTIGNEPIHKPPLPNLGEFYGFFVQMSEQKAKEFKLPSQFSIYKGVISELVQKKEAHWRDIKRIEQFLIQLAYEEGYGKFLDEFDVKGL